MTHSFDIQAYRRRTITTLMVVQILGAIGTGSTISLGALLAADLGGDAWTGMAATLTTIGAALWSIPLARLVLKRGRAFSMSLGLLLATVGAALAIVAAIMESFPLLLVSFILLGAANTANLQARFAAADIANSATKGRDISLVVWATTIGAVLGPNLIGPGNTIGHSLGLPDLVGAYLFAVAAQLAAIVLLFVALRPDPTTVVSHLHESPDTQPAPEHTIARVRGFSASALLGIVGIAIAHLVMVGIMAMTPLHLTHHGASLTIVGLTISLHVAGMFGLSPVFGFAADRFGHLNVIWAGYAILLFSAALLIVAPTNQTLVMVALIGVGLGWSAALVAGSGLVSLGAASREEGSKMQGLSDMVMNVAGAIGGALAGPMLIGFGMPGVAWAAIGALVIASAAILTVARLARA